MGKQLLLALPLVLLLLLAAPAANAAAPAPAPDESIAQSLLLLEQGRAEEANALINAALALAPEHFGLRLAQARSALAAGRHETALTAYSALAADYPGNSELVLEAARAQYIAGDKTEAMRLGRLVLAEYEKRRFHYQGHVRAGVMYDSNANQGTSSSSIRLGDWPVSVPDAKKEESFGAYAGAALDLSYRLSPVSPWHVVGDVQASVQGYENSKLERNHNREWQWGRAAAGLRYLAGDNLFDARLKVESLDHEFHTSVLAVGPEIKYVRAATPWLHLITSAGLDQRAYNRSSDYNGLYGYIGEYARLFLGPQGHTLLIGARYLGASADNSDYSYNGWEGMARLDFELPHDITLSPLVSFSQTFYNGRGTALETRDRKDDCLTLGADISYALTPSWSLEAGYRYINNGSRSNLYDYDRHVVNMGVRWSF